MGAARLGLGFRFLAYHLPDEDADVVLGAVVGGDGEDAGAHGYLPVDLDEPGAEKVVAASRLVCVALEERQNLVREEP